MVAENFEVFDNNTFDCKVLWKLGQGEWNSVAFFVLDVCSGVSGSISWARCLPVVTAESG